MDDRRRQEPCRVTHLVVRQCRRRPAITLDTAGGVRVGGGACQQTLVEKELKHQCKGTCDQNSCSVRRHSRDLPVVLVVVGEGVPLAPVVRDDDAGVVRLEHLHASGGVSTTV